MKTKLLLFFAICLTAFSVNAQVSITGVGATGGWGNGFDAYLDDTDGDGIWVLNDFTMPGGECKFRLNSDWAINWGSTGFPNGIGVQDGPNIPAIAGTYNITFNQTTGEYSFGGGAPVPVVKLVGTAVSVAEGINMTTTNLETFTASNVTLLDGVGQFEIDGALAGGTAFPDGTLIDDMSFIPIPAGEYTSVTVNIASGEYSFVVAPVYPSIAIVGSGAGGWPNDPQVDANQLTTTDGETYKGTVNLTGDAGSNEIKFRSNNNWSDPNWGGVTFPTGPDAGNPGGNIVVTATGTYDVVFTRSTGAYEFSVPTFAIVGSGAGGWPTGAVGEVDLNQLTTTDNGGTFSLNGLTLTDGEVKFRANNAWDLNYGGASLVDALVQNGPNISVTAGMYDILMNRAAGTFAITPALSNTTFNAKNFSVYPNPTNNTWNFTSTSEVITSIQVVDMLGKVVATSATSTIDASVLNSGIYFAKVASENATQTIKVVKN